jgi:hypothetical protein
MVIEGTRYKVQVTRIKNKAKDKLQSYQLPVSGFPGKTKI